MEEKPKVVVSRTRRTEATTPAFVFTQDMIAPSTGTLAAYRVRAWEAFKRLPIPLTTEEVWRRTDIHTMPADIFAFPKEGAYLDLPAVPRLYAPESPTHTAEGVAAIATAPTLPVGVVVPAVDPVGAVS